ncbi:MAG: hypothetical protein JNK48_28495 [Bryobacterales bacterium]|nr:hypothetical protein [Bryobacterales bacterium]
MSETISRYATILISLGVLAALVAFNQGSEAQRLDTLKISTGYVLLFIVLLLGLQIAVLIAAGKMDLKHLISDSEGDASMGRFQLLVFTFVVALSFFLVVLHTQAIPEIPASVLTLLGISASTFAVSKSVDAGAKPDSESKPAGNPKPGGAAEGTGDGKE